MDGDKMKSFKEYQDAVDYAKKNGYTLLDIYKK